MRVERDLVLGELGLDDGKRPRSFPAGRRIDEHDRIKVFLERVREVHASDPEVGDSTAPR